MLLSMSIGSENWSHRWRLMMNALLDHDMEVSLTSGTNRACTDSLLNLILHPMHLLLSLFF